MKYYFLFLLAILISISEYDSISNTDHIVNKYNDKEIIHIIFALDQILISLCLISIHSIVKNAIDPKRLFFHLVLVDMDWDKTLLNEFSIIFGNAQFEAVKWHPMPKIIANMNVRSGRKDLASSANYARFYVSLIFKNSSIDRFIYLDDDIIAMKPIEELWYNELDNNILGMTEDCLIDGHINTFYETVVRRTSSPQYNLNHPIVRKAFNYTLNYTCYPNAGIMLVNEKLFRDSKKVLEMEKLIALNQKQNLYRLGSQPLIVLTMWNKYLSLNGNYNYRDEMIKNINDPVLLHYKGGSLIKTFMYTILKDLNQYYNRKITNNNNDKRLQNSTNFCNEIHHQNNLDITLKRIIWCKAAIETYHKIFTSNNYLNSQKLVQLSAQGVIDHLSTITNVHDNDTIHIVIAIEKKIITFCLISIHSIVKNAIDPKRLFFHLVLVDMDWDKSLLNEFSIIFSNAQFEAVKWHPMPKIIANINDRISYARFYISSIFRQNHINRFIYLDDNIIAVNSIEELWRTELINYNIMGMVEDCQMNTIDNHFYHQTINKSFSQQFIRNYNLTHPIIQKAFNCSSNYSCYPNAGVMLFDEALYKRETKLNRIEWLLAFNRTSYLFASGFQPLLVLAIQNKYLPLNTRYNYRENVIKDIKDLVFVNYKEGYDNEMKLFSHYVINDLNQYFNTTKTYKKIMNNINYCKLHYRQKFKLRYKKLLWCKVTIETYNHIFESDSKRIQDLIRLFI